MRNGTIIGFLAFAFLLTLLTSCSNVKYLPKNESLYTGAEIKVRAPQLSKSKRKTISKQLAALTRPKPNSSILGLRPKLWFWNIGGNPKKKFSIKRLIKNMGEPPVVLSDVNVERNNAVLKSYLENIGFFTATVAGEIENKNRRAKAIYTATPGSEYTINEVKFQSDSSVLQKAILRTSRRTLLQPKKPFNLEVVKAERTRIDERLKNQGFYFFNPEYLLIDVDTTIGDHKVNMFVNTKPETPKLARTVYRIKDVVIYPTYSIRGSGSDTSRKYAVMHQGYYVVDSAKFYKPKLFQQAMQFSTGEIYRRREHNATLNRLINLGIFKFVKNRFEITGDTLLNAYYYLTPLPKKSLRIELGGNTKSNNLTGTEITLGFTNRNAFRGGEILNVSVSAGSEVQVSGNYKGYNTYRLGAEMNIAIPRFIIPFVYLNPRGGFVPRTNVQLAYEILNRKQLYTLNSFKGAYGYTWKETLQKEHTFYPISVQYVQPVKVTPLYLERQRDDPTLQKVVDTQFILGANYSYLLNQMAGPRIPRNGFYFNGMVDVSGNIAGLIKRNVIKGGDTARIFGAPFSQYLKLETDLRYYRQLGNDAVWASRIDVGSGFPYGNSKELPFIKQFFIGGNNSLRAFRSRSLGPGTFLATSTDGGFLPDQSGDIKLELNTELRFKIVKPVFGAAFVDAGNIWLYNDNRDKPGAKFSKDFLNELAVGTGLGVRVDINILVLRLDLAFPVRKPWLPEKDRWVIKEIDFGSSDWRKDNLIFNLAIGYPF
ncbi:MAG: BamA/TamA family outer membrane protein [Chitinophagaceae bacterium]|nr:BamA/TamA family outer membrane protein [Chitinophagaceae bacterium]